MSMKLYYRLANGLGVGGISGSEKLKCVRWNLIENKGEVKGRVAHNYL